MKITRRWFLKLGFQVENTPGVARAWRLEFQNGDSILLTDREGFDLPLFDEPASGLWLSRSGTVIEFQEEITSNEDFFRWLRKIINSVKATDSAPTETTE